jgi:hypothetical protein
MISHKTLPLLFSTPSPILSYRVIVLSFLIVFLALISHYSMKIWVEFPFFLIVSVLLVLHGCLCLLTTGGNVFFLLRYFLVWILIFGTSLVWYLYPQEVFVAPFGLQYQTIDNTRILTLAGLLSLVGSLMGWHISLLDFKSHSNSALQVVERHRVGMRRAGLALSASFSLLYLWKAGGILGGGVTYGTREAGFDLEFGVFNLFHFTGIALILLGSLANQRIDSKYLTLAIFTLIPGMLAGSRADFLPQAFVLFLLLFNKKIFEVISYRRYLLGIKYAAISALILAFAYLTATFIAIARGGVDPATAISLILDSDRGLLINDVYGHDMLYFETGNMMLGGLYSAVVQVREGHTGLLWGQSYLNYILITPPAFLGLPRPLGLEWATGIDGTSMAQGGIFEVAEAYWNFGLAGCFLVSLFWSYVFGWLLKKGLTAGNYFFLTWYIVFGLHGFRAIWYQNFGYFRLMTVMMVIYVFGLMVSKWYVANRRLVVSTSNQAIVR